MEGLAAPVRGKASTLADALFGEAYEFEFYQAVALLHALRPDAVPVGQGADPAAEPVAFRADVRLDFPPSDVSRIVPPAVPGDAATVHTSFMGLAGAHGPLPNVVTEVLLDRRHAKDHAFRAFLDLFNHRLISLQYRIRAEHRPGLAKILPPDTRIARYLFAAIGLGTPRLRGRMGIEDRGLLGHAAVLSARLRSGSGLETVLGEQFDVAVTAEPFCGRWLHIPPDQRTTIGRGGRNNHLGQDAVAGSRVWDQQGMFLVVLGPLSLAEFLAFLPVNDRFAPLVAITRFYAGEEFDFEIELRLRPDEIPQATMSRYTGSLLGWTSWLGKGDGGAQPGAGRPGTIRLSGRSAAPGRDAAA